MRKVLIIASSFPPMGGVSPQRTLKFVKYLPYFGWNPVILSLRKDRHTKIFIPLDNSLCSDIPKNSLIYETGHFLYWLFYPLLCIVEKESKGSKFWKYTGSIYIFQWLNLLLNRLLPATPLIGWYPYGVRKGKYIIKKHHIDLIYSTSPSVVGHLIALKLATKYNIPWVADFRDPWVYAYWDNLARPLKLLDIRLEKKVLAGADRIVVLEPKILNEIKMLKKNFNPAHCFIIHNGYDEEDFKDISPHIFQQFTIIYTGKLHELRRSPHYLFASLNSLFQEYPDLKSKIKVVFIGDKYPFIKGLIKGYNLDNCIDVLDYLEHKKILSYICGASVLFLLTEETKNLKKPFQGKDVIPAKLYEYLRARRPILALVPQDSDCARIVQDTCSGVVIDPTDYEKAKEVILDMYKKYIKGELKPVSNDNLIQQYDRKDLTSSLAKIFDDLLSEKILK